MIFLTHAPTISLLTLRQHYMYKTQDNILKVHGNRYETRQMSKEMRDFLLFDRKFSRTQLDCEKIFAGAPQNLRLWRLYSKIQQEHKEKINLLRDASKPRNSKKLKRSLHNSQEL